MSALTVRDPDKVKVYAAESAYVQWLEPADTLIDEHRFDSVRDIQSYVDETLLQVGCVDPCRVRPGKGNEMAMYHSREKAIVIPESAWALRESVVLHELAHHLVGASRGHGLAFRSAHVNLVETVLGHEASKLLQYEYFQRGLKC